MDLRQLSLAAKFPDARHQVPELGILQHASHAQLHRQRLTPARQGQGAPVVVRRIDQAGRAAQTGQGRVVGVQGHAHAGRLADRDEPLQEIGEVVQ